MLHFLTGMYYFTWFENLLIIIAGLSLGHFIQLIVQQVIAIRNRRSLTKIIRAMIPWLAVLLVLMLSPVFASRIAVGWMVIIGIFECVIERLVIARFGQQLHRPTRQRQHTDQAVRSDHHSTAKQRSAEHEQSVKSESAAQQAQAAASAVKPAASAAQQPAKSAGFTPSTEHQSPAVMNQSASASAAGSQAAAPAAESHQPTSQEIMDHMFDFDPNVDYEAEAKAAEAKAAADSQNQEDEHGGKD